MLENRKAMWKKYKSQSKVSLHRAPKNQGKENPKVLQPILLYRRWRNRLLCTWLVGSTATPKSPVVNFLISNKIRSAYTLEPSNPASRNPSQTEKNTK